MKRHRQVCSKKRNSFLRPKPSLIGPKVHLKAAKSKKCSLNCLDCWWVRRRKLCSSKRLMCLTSIKEWKVAAIKVHREALEATTHWFTTRLVLVQSSWYLKPSKCHRLYTSKIRLTEMRQAPIYLTSMMTAIAIHCSGKMMKATRATWWSARTITWSSIINRSMTESYLNKGRLMEVSWTKSAIEQVECTQENVAHSNLILRHSSLGPTPKEMVDLKHRNVPQASGKWPTERLSWYADWWTIKSSPTSKSASHKSRSSRPLSKQIDKLTSSHSRKW